MTKPSSKSSKAAPKPVTIDVDDALIDFIKKISRYAESGPRLKCYRGQRDSAWSNIPGLYRPDLARLEQNEKRAVRDLISVHPSEFAGDDTMFDRLVRMQHFGLPTRLMDVSLNPLVALYFATDPGPKDGESDGLVTAFAVPGNREKYYDSDAVSCIANLANMTKDEKNEFIEIRALRNHGAKRSDEIKRANVESCYERLYAFIRMEKPHFMPIIDPIDLFKPYYVHPKMSNRRILAQAGGFIIHGLRPRQSIRFSEPFVETRFVIPEEVKAPARKALELLGITESTLFPEIDKAAKRIEASYSKI